MNEQHAALIKEYEEARNEFILACDMDSGDEASDDWLSATAGDLEQARRALVQYEKDNNL